jgi:hypothetical protein
MSRDSRVYWPAQLSGMSGTSTQNELAHASMTMDAAGEKFGILVPFDGSELDFIELALVAGTQADTIELTIQDYENVDTVNVGGFPDGTAIANSTVSVSNKGGASEIVRWTFGATGPSPQGHLWIVIAPSSAGAFNVKLSNNWDWGIQGALPAGSNSGVRLYTTAWSGGVSIGSPIVRVQKKDGSWLRSPSMVFPPFTNIESTFNFRIVQNSNVAGAKFLGPFTGTAIGAVIYLFGVDPFGTYNVLLVDGSDNILAEGVKGYYWGASNRTTEIIFPEPASITAGETYRLLVYNPLLDTNRIMIQTVSAPAGTYEMLQMDPNETVYTNATDPPCLGGVGTYTDTNLEIPMMQLVGLMDLSAPAVGASGTIGIGAA